MKVFGFDPVSIGVGIVVAQFLPGTVGAWIVAKVKAIKALLAAGAAKIEAAAAADVKKL